MNFGDRKGSWQDADRWSLHLAEREEKEGEKKKKRIQEKKGENREKKEKEKMMG